jgi:hypothetical protein
MSILSILVRVSDCAFFYAKLQTTQRNKSIADSCPAACCHFRYGSRSFGLSKESETPLLSGLMKQ